MKNMGKFLGIIALLLVIGVMVSCDVAPEDQVTITFTNFPEGAEELNVYIELNSADTSTETPKLVAKGSVLKQIRGGKVTCEMVDYNTSEAFGKEGGYFINLRLYPKDATSINGTPDYLGTTSAQKAIKKGDNKFDISGDIFFPSILAKYPAGSQPVVPTPPANNFGTYTTSYSGTINGASGTVVESVDLSQYAFNISDNAAGTSDPDRLNFKIESWEAATVPSTLTGGYTGGYKFTGRILTQKNYVPSLRTAPQTSGFSASTVATDVKSDGTGTVCWMYIYFKGETGNITFVRSALSRTGSTENKDIVVGNETPPVYRVYTKQ